MKILLSPQKESIVIAKGTLKENILSVVSLKDMFIRPWDIPIKPDDFFYVAEVVKYLRDNLF